MKSVIDTGALSWLARLDYLHLLPQVYEQVIAPPGVIAQLKAHHRLQEFLEHYITPLQFQTEKERRRFYRITRRWYSRLGPDDIVDAEVFVAYKFFTDADEALYANKEAKHKFGPYGIIRDIADLYEIAEQTKIFSRENSIAYLEKLIQVNYNTRYVQQVLEKIGL